MHAILISLGTDGDVYPYVGLGMALRSRGHLVTLVVNEHFRALAENCGFAFRALVSNRETDDLLGNRDFWHPVKSALVASRWGAPMVPRQYELLAELAKDENCVLVANPGVPVARLVQEKLSKPLVSLVLQPWLIPSVFAPPRMMGGLTLPARTPRLLGNLYWRFMDAAVWLLFGRQLNQLRRSLNLKPISRFFRWWVSPEMVIGMFPDWYGEPQKDWPPQVRLAGFPMYDGEPSTTGLPAEVLEFCRAGDPPVAFTFGTGMRHAEGLIQAGMEAAQILGLRSIVLTKHRSQLPAVLPSGARYCEFAPFQKLFPLCAAVVHHGGVGTVAKALAAGIPQLVVPLAFDQLDNAARVKRIGAGCYLKSNPSSAQIARALAGLMTRRTKSQCQAVAKRFHDNNALELAAQWIEELYVRDARLASCKQT